MHMHVNDFAFTGNEHRVAIVGFLLKEVRRIEHLFRSRGIDLAIGGSIEDGSNMVKNARQALQGADLVFLNVKAARTLKPEDLAGARVVHCLGISQIKRLFDAPTGQPREQAA